MISWNGYLLRPRRVAAVRPRDVDGRVLIDLSGGQTISVYATMEKHAELVALLTAPPPRTKALRMGERIL